MDEGRPEQPLAHDVDPPGRGGPDVLLVEDDLLGHGGPPAAVLGRPPEARPAPLGQHLLPAPPDLEAERLVARAATPAQLGELADQVLVEEAAHLEPERDILGAVTQIHRPGA